MKPLLRLLPTLAVACALTLPAGPAAQAQPIELPALGDASADDLSLANERKLGEQIMRQIRRDKAYLADPDTLEYLNNLGYRLVAASPARHMDFTFFAIRDPTLNAFALPGGFIGMHTGLIIAAQSESELASVLAHEIGHVDQRHIARMLSNQKDSVAITIGTLLLAVLASRYGGNSSGDLAQAAILGGQSLALQQQLSFSRDAEREADRVGFQSLTAAGYDPRGMADFFTRLQQGTRIYESAAPAYLRTHPMTVERIADMQNRLQGTSYKPRPDSLDFHLVRARLRVLQDDTVQGWRDAREHFESQLRSRTAVSETATRYGVALATLRLNQPEQAYSLAQAARKSTRESAPMLDKLVAEARFAAAGTNQAERLAAIQMARDATQRYPLSRLTALTYVDLLQQDGQHEAAVAYMREQLAISRSDTTFYSLVARSYAELGKKSLHHQAVAEAYLLLGVTPAALEQLTRARAAADADYYTMSEIDARWRQVQQQWREEQERLGRVPPSGDGQRSDRSRPQ
ncbi:MAG: M48 family metalloprotease [Burkholderiales bacterium]|nr:M48 family metalloprotease [Burkholderiales bacterium]